MLSRVAENLYWMSRYLERAENVARLLDVGFYLELDAGEHGRDDGSAPVEIVLNILACRMPSGRPTRRPSATAVLGFPHLRPVQPAVDPQHDRPGTRERPRHPGEPSASRPGARSTGSISTSAASAPSGGSRPARPRSSQTIKQSCILFDGLIQSTLPRDEVFHFSSSAATSNGST